MYNTTLPAIMSDAAVEILPDTERHKCRIKVRSSSSNSLHMVSYDAAPGANYWVCSCRGNIRWGQCKHLTALNLKGRKFGRCKLEYNSNGKG